MNRQPVVRIVVASVLSLCGGAALSQQSVADKKATPGSSAALDQMVAAGKSQRELAQYLFDTHGCKDCHTIGSGGRLGFTAKGKERSQGFEGCISTLKAMSVIAKVPANQRSATQRQRAQRFEEFGCATCHKLSPDQMGLTEVGAKLGNLHLGCVDVQKLLASKPGTQD